jgi:endonuclease-3
MADILLTQYNGVIPDTIEELVKLRRGRKTANLIIGDIYHKPSVVADTHCIRISNRLGLCQTTDPYKVELALRKICRATDRAPSASTGVARA